MEVLIKKAIVTQNQTIHKGENPFQAGKITEVLEDGSTQDYANRNPTLSEGALCKSSSRPRYR